MEKYAPGARFSALGTSSAQYSTSSPIVAYSVRPRTPPEAFVQGGAVTPPERRGLTQGMAADPRIFASSALSLSPSTGTSTPAARSWSSVGVRPTAALSPGLATPPGVDGVGAGGGTATSGNVAVEVGTRLASLAATQGVDGRRRLVEAQRPAHSASVVAATYTAPTSGQPQATSMLHVPTGIRPLPPASPTAAPAVAQTLPAAAPASMAVASETRMSGAAVLMPMGAAMATPGPAATPGPNASVQSLEQLIQQLTVSLTRREHSLREQVEEKREIEELLAQSKAEFRVLTATAERMRRVQDDGDPARGANDVPALLGPERPRCRQHPPFSWQPSADYEREFEVGGECGEVVTKISDFEEKGWVIPVGGTLRLARGGVYRWTLRIERKCPHRPQLQLGVHGVGHQRPWRLLTTSRCSRARDDDPWVDRPGGDRMIQEGDYVHFEVDLRGLHQPLGLLSVAINAEPAEVVFDDIPLSIAGHIIPVVSMGGDQSRVRLCPSY